MNNAAATFIKEDAAFIAENFADTLAALDGKSILVTGATGLIGCNLVATLLAYGAHRPTPPKVIALARDCGKAEALFAPFNTQQLSILPGDVMYALECPYQVDYIVHAASQTASKAFVNAPIKTIDTAINGTRNLLEMAREKRVAGFVFLSTMEVYGAPATEEKIDENHSTNLNPMAVRSCYPESKRLCEALCAAYGAEYGVPVNVLRLTQTFGPGVQYDDGRVFAEFARCAIEGRDIVLHTVGNTKRNYLYTADAVSAILTLLTKGGSGEAYNAANEDTYCSIREMAELVAAEVAHGRIGVKVELGDTAALGYAPTLCMNLNTAKLRALGWHPTLEMRGMFERLVTAMK